MCFIDIYVSFDCKNKMRDIIMNKYVLLIFFEIRKNHAAILTTNVD